MPVQTCSMVKKTVPTAGTKGPDWNLLPPELVQLISEKLVTILEFVRFRAVCPEWRSASSPRPRHLPPQLPWLILPLASHGEESATFSMYDLSQSRTHTVNLLQIRDKIICGTSHGWLVLQKDKEVWLFNPITKDQINLPSLSAEYYDTRCFIRNVVLSSNPGTDPDCLVMALIWFGPYAMTFCKIGDLCWTLIPYEGTVKNICYHNGLFHATDLEGYVWICDIRNSFSNFLTPTFYEDSEKYFGQFCIVKGGCAEHRLMIFHWDFSYYPELNPTIMYDILMLSDKDKWVAVEEKQLVGNVFFLGSGGGVFDCITLPVAGLKLDEWEGGCMRFMFPYFEEMTGSIKLVGVDYMHTKKLDNYLASFDCEESLQYGRPRFLWLTPSLC